jgi:hypothetical protein
MAELWCTSCGAQGQSNPDCSCGKPYVRMKPREAAALAIAKHPDWSDRMIEESTGVSDTTILRARNAGASKEAPEKRTGRDGKRQAARKHKNPPEREAEAAALVLDRGLSYAKAAAAAGLDGSVQIMKTAVAKEEGRRETDTEPVVTRDMLSPSAQRKFDAAARQYQQTLDAQFEWRVQADIKRRVDDFVMPRLREREEHAERVARARKGVFKLAEYNAILRCVHPDAQPSIEQKNEAFRLLHENRLVLLSEKEDTAPRTYSGLPTVEEFMRGYPWKAKA